MKTDEETEKIMSEADMVRNTMGTPGWGVMERKFFEYLGALDSVQNITETDPVKIAELILVNQKVYKTLELFWNDIIGDKEISEESKIDTEEKQTHIQYKE